MNVQKLGLVLGVNMVAACLMMQGCAAPGSAKAGRRAPQPPPPSVEIDSMPADRTPAEPTPGDRTITVVSMPVPSAGEGPQVSQATTSTLVTTTVTTATPDSVATPAQPATSTIVTQVKPLPVQVKKAPAKTKVATAPVVAPAAAPAAASAAPVLPFRIRRPGPIQAPP